MVLLILITLLALLSPFTASRGQDKPAEPRHLNTWTAWPFSGEEAKARQAETAADARLPVEKSIVIGDGVAAKFRLIPAGRFMIGSPESEDGHEGDERQHEETIAEPFYILETQLTVAQYRVLMHAEPAESGDGGLPAGILYRDTVDKVLPALATLAPAGWKVILPDHPRLEYAARAGIATMNPGGNKPEDAAAFAWSRENSDGKVHPVAQKRANAWGLYDVIGNRWHWFWRAGAGYGNDSTDDHIVYGGSYNSESGGNGVRLANIMISKRQEGARFALIREDAQVPKGHPETRLVAAQSGAGSAPASSNLPNADYPRIASDMRATFRLKAPEAKQVKLEGGAGLVKAPLEMTKGEDGTWSVTTPPAVPGFHYYWFMVDGLRVNDGASRLFFGWGRDTSGIEVPEAGADFYDAKVDVPHGEVRTRWYHSKLTGQWRRAHVYTPAEYDRKPAVRYPVLYLQHGAGENERSWIEQGRAGFILDNLIAAGKAKPMIVVVDTGYAAFAEAAASTDRQAATAAFEQVMLTELIPMIDSTYRTLADQRNRAMAGLSMGSGQTLSITLKHLDTFAWIGAMSGPPRQGFEVATSYDGVFRDAAAFNAKVKLLWLGAGTAEERIHASTVAMHEALTGAGVKNVFYSSPGTDHEWQTWRRCLHEFAPRLFRDGP